MTGKAVTSPLLLIAPSSGLFVSGSGFPVAGLGQLTSQPTPERREPKPAVHGAVQVMFPPAVVWYVRQIGEPPGFWAAPWRPRATHMPRRPSLPSSPCSRRLEPFRSSLSAHFGVMQDHILFDGEAFSLIAPLNMDPKVSAKAKTALKPATAPSPSDPCVHRLRLLCAVWQAPAVDFISCQVLHVMAEMETLCLVPEA